MSIPSVLRALLIISILLMFIFQYSRGSQWLRKIEGIYASSWLMLANIELCVMQIIVCKGWFLKSIFVFLFLVSFVVFWISTRKFLLMEKKQFFRSKWFYHSTFGTLFIMLAGLIKFIIYG